MISLVGGVPQPEWSPIEYKFKDMYYTEEVCKGKYGYVSGFLYVKIWPFGEKPVGGVSVSLYIDGIQKVYTNTADDGSFTLHFSTSDLNVGEHSGFVLFQKGMAQARFYFNFVVKECGGGGQGGQGGGGQGGQGGGGQGGGQGEGGQGGGGQGGGQGEGGHVVDITEYLPAIIGVLSLVVLISMARR